MADRGEPNRQGPILALVGLAIAAFLCAVAAVAQSEDSPAPDRVRDHAPGATAGPTQDQTHRPTGGPAHHGKPSHPTRPPVR